MGDLISDDLYLDSFGQIPSLHQIYTHMCLFFNVPDSKSYPAIIDNLRHGLSQLSKDLPWVGGHVVNEGVKPGNTGIFKIKFSKDTAPELVVKDVRQDPAAPSMSELRASRFPIGMLKEEMLAPRSSLGAEVADNYPVLVLQATIIDGGLVLDFQGEHGVLDGMGQGQLMNLLAKACRKEAFTSEEMAHGNLPRRNLIETLGEEVVIEPYLDAVPVGLSKDHQDVDQEQPKDSENQPPPPPPRCSWVNFGFSVESLAAIKSLAASTMTTESKYISTDDALCAFIWQFLTRRKLSRMYDKGYTATTTTTTFGRAIDARRYVGVPADYAGLCVSTRHRTHSARQLAESETIGSIASKLRADIDPETCDYGLSMRAMATLFERSPDRSFYNVFRNIENPMNLSVSSWVKLSCQNKDYGPGLGQPEALRLPTFGPAEGLMIFLPETAHNGGGIVAVMCLRSEDIEALRNDATWTAYATYIG